MDKNLISSDTLLGETVVDLEDRWYHPEWTKLGDSKPLEVRTLRKDGAVMNSKSSAQVKKMAQINKYYVFLE